MKIDPYKHEIRYNNWKAKLNNSLPNISKTNSKIILDYVFDMENGINISPTSKKGARSYARLNNIRQRLTSFCIKLEKLYKLNDLTKITEEQLFDFFGKIRNGEIKTNNGKVYQSAGDYIKVFKAFWHWHQKINRKRGIEIQDITIDLDTSHDKPEWVYLTEDQVKRLVDNATYDYKVLMMFLYDSGIRAPTELINTKVSDFYNDFKELNIRDEISKTFGRRIKLMICSNLIKEYVLTKDLKSDDYLFTKEPKNMNKYIKRLGKRILGDVVSPAGQKYSQLTMYDFRHCSCCYWLPRYKSESALKFRFGWKKSDKIHYYSEMLGMKDTILEDDLLVDLTKTEIENRLSKTENEKQVLQDRVDVLEKQMKIILQMVNNTCFFVGDEN